MSPSAGPPWTPGRASGPKAEYRYGPGSPVGLRTLVDLKKEVSRDLRRTGASIALNKSMDARLVRNMKTGTSRPSTGPVKRPSTIPGSREQDPQETGLPERRGSVRRTSVSQERKQSAPWINAEDIKGLQDAFNNHKAAFDLDGDGTINVEELIIIFTRCHLFNEHFTPEKIRDYFRTRTDGCNYYAGLSKPLPGDDGIGFAEFNHVLHWAADMSRLEFDSCVQKVVSLSRRLCDKEASVQRRLEVVFDSFCKKHPARMNAFEFGRLCRKLELQFCMGDVFCLFSVLPGGVQGEGVDFAGFVQLLKEVGERLELGEDVYPIAAKMVELLDTDEETINRVRMRLRHSAQVVGGTDWRRFFQDCDPDGSGCIDWGEFKELCRVRLHLTDKDSHLRLLFERIDTDGSDELSIEELIEFVAQEDSSPRAFTAGGRLERTGRTAMA